MARPPFSQCHAYRDENPWHADWERHGGDVEPCTESDIIARARHAMQTMQAASLMDYMPWTSKMESRLHELAAWHPNVHHDARSGLPGRAPALRDLASVMHEVLGATYVMITHTVPQVASCLFPTLAPSAF
jgi:hypothetical protein